jgi:hypothetical protein
MTPDDLDAHIRRHAEPDGGPPALGCAIVMAGLVYLTAGVALVYFWSRV